MALIISAFCFGALSGMPVTEVLESITEGFGSTVGGVGLIIILGIIIGTFLEKSGGALKLAEKVLQFTGKKRVHTANALIGYIISIPVFADSGFLILSSLNKALSKKAKLSFAGTVAALALGLSASHALVPPTPGPIAAAGILGADLGLVFILGVTSSLFALMICIQYAKYIGRKIYIDPDTELSPPEKTVDRSALKPPSGLKAIIPLVVPIVLILLRSVAQYPTEPLGSGQAIDILILLGNPVIALFIGALLSLSLPEKLEKSMLGSSGWIGEAIKEAAIIILITGAGGGLGKVLQNSDLGTVLSDIIQQAGIGIWVPFIMAAAFKTAQGSSTVAIITTASIMAPLLATLGIDSGFDKALVVAAIGAGSLVVSHANDSYFWVVTQLSNFSVNQGYRIHSVGTLILGGSAIIFLSMVSLFFN
jgi:GntP family gluconate:H+ symporter